MSQFPSLPLFTDAYIADTQHLTNEEHGAYLRLLMFAWRSPDCRLPDDDARLARMLGLTAKKWAALKPSVMSFWALENGFWTQRRLAREHAFVSAKVEKRRAAGSQGGRPKSFKNKDEGEPNGFDPEKQNQSIPKAPTPTPTPTQLADASLARETRMRVVEAFNDIAPKRLPPDTNRVVVWLEQGYDPNLIVAVIREILPRKPDVGSLSYFDRPLAEAKAGRQPEPTSPTQASTEPRIDFGNGVAWPRSSVEKVIATWVDDPSRWPESALGPPPGAPGCRVPPDLLPRSLH